MTAETKRSETQLEDAVQPVIVGAMIGCLALSLVWAAERFVPGWNATYVAIFCGLTAVEAGYSYRVLRRVRPAASRGFQFRLIELASLFVVRQMWADIVEGRGVVQGGVPRFDLAGAWMYLPVLLAWLLATNMAARLDGLREQPGYDARYVPPQRHLGMCVFIGGIVLLIVAALTQADMSAAWGAAGINSVSHPAHAARLIVAIPVSGPVWNVLVYFLLGVVLLGQAQYAALRRHWQDQELPIAGGLESRWLRYVLALVGCVTALALVLPTAHTAYALNLLQAGWHLCSTATAQVGALATLLSVKLAGLFGLQHTHNAVAHPRPGSSMPVPYRGRHIVEMAPARSYLAIHDVFSGSAGVPDTPPGGGPLFSIGSWMGALKALALWSAVMASVVYRLHVARRRPQVNGGASGLWGGLQSFLRQLRAALRFSPRPYVNAAAKQVKQGLAFKPHSILPAVRVPRMVRLRPRSPYEQVVRCYLAMLRHAKQHGFPRQPSDTPYQIGAALACQLPEAGEEVHRLTAAFVHARYSGRVVERTLATRAIASLRGMRTALQRRRRTSGAGAGQPEGRS